MHIAVLLLQSLSLAAWGQPAQDLEFFERQVRPVLARNCHSCHGPDKQFAGLRLDSRSQILKGGKSGAAIQPGKPESSLLIKAVRHDGLKMPMGGKLKDDEIAALETWVRNGAPWPAGDPVSRNVAASTSHWAFTPVRPQQPPAGRASNPVDRFLQAALAQAKLKPAGPADRATLIRRLSFVLTGLPPKPEDVERFVNDRSADAYPRLVDAMLQSPHFGERWARHWLDLMRFAETYGYEWNYETLGAWHFRDYLIRAFNGDVPYDQLIREHLAGDLLPTPRLNAKLGINESLVGTAFFRLGEMGHDDCVEFREIRTDVVDNQIDTLGKAFQGLTISCARCHDHKLDPIPTEDYYALYGVLTSARQVTRTMDTPEVHSALLAELKALKPRIAAEVGRVWVQADAGPALLAKQPPAPPKEDAQKDPPKKEGPKLEDPLHIWFTVKSAPDVARAWEDLAREYRAQGQSRAAFNRENFRPFGDFHLGGFAGWHADGIGLREGASPAGEFAVASEGPSAVTGVFPAGVYTHRLSDRVNGALRSPMLPKDKKFISMEVMGGRLGARRKIIDNCMLGEDYQVLENPALAWFKTGTLDDQKQLPTYVELATKFDNPRLPDRPEKIKDFKMEQLESPGSFFGVTRAVVHDVDETPRPELSHLLRLFDGPAPKTKEEVAARFTNVLRSAAQAWVEGRASDDDARWLDWFQRSGVIGNSKDATPRLAELIARYRETEARLSRPRVINAMSDLDPGYNMPVFRSGDPKSQGPPVPRRYLKLLSKADGGFQAMGSGRAELAALIASAENPLTARVMVNRVWHHVFGRGIVPTVDNFGRFGDTPSHPEMLDYLAGRFVQDGWSIKKLIRLMVTTEAFQQASGVQEEQDPANRLLHHYPVRRLEAEAIRDAILFTSGRLDRTMHGPSLQPFRQEPKDYRKLNSGPLDGGGRRSVYLKVTRMEGSRFLELFDFPPPMQTRGGRDVTNVAPQALAMLNDPFVLDQAGVWADRVLRDGSKSVDERLNGMFRDALGRPPAGDEMERFRGLAAELASLHNVPRQDLIQDKRVWKDVAHAVFNLKEFIYLR